MRFFDKLKPEYTPVTIQGVDLRIKKLNWAELSAIQGGATEIESDEDPSAAINLFESLCRSYVQEGDGTPITFTNEQPASAFPVAFCLEVIKTVFIVASSGLPTTEDAKKK